MAKQEAIQQDGIVEVALPNGEFKVKLENGHLVRGYISGKIRRFYIRILPGDKVTLEMSPYNLTIGRIVYRHKITQHQL